MSIPSPTGMGSRDSCLQLDTHNSLGTSGHVFEDLPARGEPSSALFENSKNLAPSSGRLSPTDAGKTAEQKEGLRKEPQNHAIPTPRFARKFLNLESCTSCRKNLSSKLSDGKSEESDLGPALFPDTSNFQCWKTNFKTEVCSCSGCPTIALLWIKEVEVAKSVDDLMTSQSSEGRDFTVFEMLGAKIASSLKRIISDLTRTSEEEFVTKSKPLKRTTDLYEEDTLLIWCMTNFEQSALKMQLLIYQIFSLIPYKETTFKISIQGGIKLYQLPVEYPKRTSWKVCTGWKYEILFSFRQYWMCTNKKLSSNEKLSKNWRQW